MYSEDFDFRHTQNAVNLSWPCLLYEPVCGFKCPSLPVHAESARHASSLSCSRPERAESFFCVSFDVMAKHEEPQLHGYGNGISNGNTCERTAHTVCRCTFHTVPLRAREVLNGLCTTLPDVLVDGELEWNVR